MKKAIYILIGLILIVAGFVFFTKNTQAPIIDNSATVSTSTSPQLCSPESRKAEICTMIYAPVCAKVQVQCIKAPCPPIEETFASQCTACANPLVESYVNGECPTTVK